MLVGKCNHTGICSPSSIVRRPVNKAKAANAFRENISILINFCQIFTVASPNSSLISCVVWIDINLKRKWLVVWLWLAFIEWCDNLSAFNFVDVYDH